MLQEPDDQGFHGVGRAAFVRDVRSADGGMVLSGFVGGLGPDF